MNAWTRLFTRWPWLTIAVILVISAFFAYQLRYVRVDNEIKEFMPELQPERQQYFRSLHTFGGEFAAIVGLSVEDNGPAADIYNPRALRVVQELTDWLEGLEIEAPFEYAVWVKPEEAPAIVAQQDKNKTCTPEQIKEIEAHETPVDLSQYVRVWVCRAPKKISLDRVTSLATMKIIYDQEVPPVTPGGEPEHKLMIDDPWPSVPQTQPEADRVRDAMGTWQIYENNVVSPPDPQTGRVKSTAIYAFLPDGITIDFGTALQKQLERKIAELDKPDDGLMFMTGGVPMISVWLGQYLLRDLRLLIPFVVLVIIIVLILSFRSPGGVALPLLTVVLGTLWTVGLTALMRRPLTLITSAIPTLITAVGSAYTIHVYHHYVLRRHRGMMPREAVHDAMTQVGMAVVMAGLTTVGGFLSLATSSVVPIKDFGYFASFGTLASLFITLSLAPAILVLGKNRPLRVRGATGQPDPARGWLGRTMRGMARLITTRPKTLAVGTILAIAAGGFLASRVVASSNIAHYFLADSEIRQADNYLISQFGGTNLFSISIDGGAKDYWKNPAALHKLEALETYIQQRFPQYVAKTMSVNDYLKKMWMALNYNDPAAYRLPDTQQGVADCLFLFSQKSDALDSVIDFDYQRVRLMVKVRHGGTNTMGVIFKDINHWIDANWPEMQGRPVPPPPWWKFVLINLSLVNPPPKMIYDKLTFSGESFMRYTVDRLIVVG
jgi:predicted RND superfamily exporter protein